MQTIDGNRRNPISFNPEYQIPRIFVLSVLKNLFFYVYDFYTVVWHW